MPEASRAQPTLGDYGALPVAPSLPPPTRGLRSPSPKSRAAFATAASSGVRTIQGELQGKLEAVDEKRQGVKAKAGGVVQGVKNKAKTKVLETALHKAGVELLQALTKDKWMPQPVHQSITNMFRSVWPEVEAVLFDLLYETMDSSQPKKDKKDKKRPWPAAPPSKREQPLRWFRARVVYAIFPADATFWHKVRQPDLLLFLVLLVVPYFGIATLMWLILLVFIDWDCAPRPGAPRSRHASSSRGCTLDTLRGLAHRSLAHRSLAHRPRPTAPCMTRQATSS